MEFELEEELIEMLKRDGKKLCMEFLGVDLSLFEKWSISQSEATTIDQKIETEYGYIPSKVIDKSTGFMVTFSNEDRLYLGVNIIVRGANL